MVREIHVNEFDALAGQELGVSDWHVVSQDQIDLFAKATGDAHWTHVDVPRAEREIGGTFAHGLLTLSLIPFLSHDIFQITGYKGGYSYGYDKVRLINVVKVGALLRLRATMNEPEVRGDGVISSIKCVIEIEGQDRPALVTDWREIYYV
jgi:acyl dehydratase